MDFDPLTLFSPKESKGNDEYTVDLGTLNSEYAYLTDLKVNISTNATSELELFDELAPLHILDLPMLSAQPPKDVLLLILKLMALDEVWNFNQDDFEREDPSNVFENKNISYHIIELSIPWLEQFCPRLNSVHKLQYLPKLCMTLKTNNSYNEWLTRIVSNDLKWLNTEDKDLIQKEASLRISENCGRTAQPELIRKIKLKNMHHIPVDYITLKEPSLTNDNLGLKTWGSSLILSQKLINDKSLLKEPILELGSGTGLVGITCKLLGYNDIYLTDLKEILPNLKDNLLLNGLDGHVEELDWENPLAFCQKHPALKFKTIILSDPIYSADHPHLIKKVLSQFVGKDTTVIIQVPLRRSYEDVRDLLWKLLDEELMLIHEENEVGPDEFGDIPYCFKKFVFRSIN